MPDNRNAVTAMFRSQHGEDALLAERFDYKRDGYYVEVGALDGETISNTYFFEKALGWTGVLVEANPAMAEQCRLARPRSLVAATAVSAPGAPETLALHVAEGPWAGMSSVSPTRVHKGMLRDRHATTHTIRVPTATLDRVLEDAGTTRIDFISIDVEGHEADVLRGFDLRRWRPAVVLIECATGLPDLHSTWRFFTAGYAPLRRIVVNDWYEPAGPARRIRLFAAYLARSAPGFVRLVVRESLRSTGLLNRARRALGRTTP